jgi:ATP-binding cassette subfamily C (CFTR/MRP) protein 1
VRPDSIVTLAHLGIIAAGAQYAGLLIPFVLATAYYLQKFYLMTSRQVRLLDLEAKSPLYSHFTDTLQGLATMRAFGWQPDFQLQLEHKLDVSQVPFYLLFCIQRWLTLVSDLIVAGIAVVLVSLATQIKYGHSGDSVALGLISILSFSESLTTMINAYTNMETSIAAVQRVKELEETVSSEDLPEEVQTPPEIWPASGSIILDNVSASYEYVLP